MNIIRSGLILGLIIGVPWMVAGCSGKDDDKSAKTDGHKDEAGKHHKQPKKDDAHKDHKDDAHKEKVATKDDQKDKGQKDKPESKHDGWWCEEHGVPESICSMCLPDDVVKKMFKDKNDWCEKHERAKSQCFKCNPKLYEKFVAMYKAKFGQDKEPPRPPESEFKE